MTAQSLAGMAGRVRHDQSGASAVEFVLVVPLLLGLYIAGTEVAIAVTINRKVQHVASTVSDLVAQSDSLTRCEITDIMSFSAALIEPYDAGDLRIRITAVYIDADGNATVDWSQVSSAALTEEANGTPVPTLLPSLAASLRDRYLLVAQAYYDHVPLGGYGLEEPVAMQETAYNNPRIGTRVKRTAC